MNWRVFSLWLTLGAMWLQIPASAQQAPIPIRIGVLSFEDSGDPSARYREQARLLLTASPPLRASFAIGSYGEVAHWVDQGMVDVAVVTPGLFAHLPKDKWTYIGSAKVENADVDYRSVCLARKDAHLGNVGALREEGLSLQVLAVDPLSMSGFLNPLAALHAAGVVVLPEQVRFTFSHSNSLRILASTPGKQIACVWAATWKRHPDPNLEVVDVPGLDAYQSQTVAIVGRAGTPATKSLIGLVKARHFPGFIYDEHYETTSDALMAALPNTLSELASSPNEGVDLNDLMLTLHLYNSTHATPARLALVLAGGGAKCSYQVGAVRALEEKLEESRKKFSDEQLDIKLVVGTSGGAINALSVAMGLTRTAEGYVDLCGAWNDLDQREIVCPPRAVRINLYAWFASIAGLFLLATIHTLQMRRRNALVLTAATGAVLMSLPHLPWKPWRLLSKNGDLDHFWAWLSWGVEGAGAFLIAAAIVAAVAALREHSFTARVGKPRVITLARLLTLLVCILPIVQAWTMFCYEEVISENKGLEQALKRNFSKLITRESGRKGQAPASLPNEIGELSKEMFSRKLLRRDLVLTASPLTEANVTLPGEFYFYAPAANASADDEPAFGARGVALVQRPELLFDALLGSAAIYPLFPSRRVDGVPTSGHHVDLVDGSFAHRSPLEAALGWGATHVVLIEASTQEVAGRGKLLDNFGAALSYLYDEAQLTDVRARGQTSLYTLYPSAPHIGLLDFSSELIDGSIHKGYREAQGVPTSVGQRGGALHKEVGPPVFWTP